MRDKIDTLSKLDDRLDQLKKEALARGEDIAPTGTYTLSNREAALVSLSLGIVGMIVQGHSREALLLAAISFAGKEKIVETVLHKVSQEIIAKQAPGFIKQATAEFVDDHGFSQ